MTVLRLVPVDAEAAPAELLRLPATVGSGPDADVCIAGCAPRHAVLFEREGEVVLVDSGSPEGTTVGGRAVDEVVLGPGDVIQLGPAGPRLRVELAASPAAAAVQAEPPLSQTMIARVMRRTSRPFWVALALLAAAAAVTIAFTQAQARRMEAEVSRLRQEMAQGEADRRSLIARVLEERKRSERERASLEDQLAGYRAREEELARRMADSAAGEVQVLRQELDSTRKRIATLESEREVGERIIRQYGGGVALIQGSYAFFDAQGRPLREGDEAEGHEEGGEPAIRTVEYYGTGFLVDPSGILLTNRHVAEPWWNDTPAEAMKRRGYEPRFLGFRAFFPGHQGAFDLEVERVSEKADLAVVRVALKGRKVPVLPLARGRNSAVAGQPVVVVGYPTGLEAILAKAETSVVKSILESHGAEPERVTEALSRRGLIRPSTTQGHIGDITRSDIVFDAPSAQGGSGGPVFNKHGEVIAVEYAVLPKFGGNSFGIPVSYVLEILKEARAAPGD